MAADEVGDVQVSANPDALANPVTQQPATEAGTYLAFVESVVKSDLAEIVYDAFPVVQNANVPADARIKWPPGYGTNVSPWGQQFDPVTGKRERTCDNENGQTRWTDFINATAKGRLGSLQEHGDLAVAIATGIIAALDEHINQFHTGIGLRGGTASLDNGGLSSPISVPNFSASTRLVFSIKNYGPFGDPGTLRARTSERTYGDPGTFVVRSDQLFLNNTASFDWLAFG